MSVWQWLPRPSLGHTDWPTRLQVSNVRGVWHCPLTCSDWPFSWRQTLRFTRENAIRLFDPFNARLYGQFLGQANAYMAFMDVSLWCKAWWMDGWWVRTMSHCFGSQSSTGKMYMYHYPEWWLRRPKFQQSWTSLTQDSAESGWSALTKNGWENSRKRRRK